MKCFMSEEEEEENCSRTHEVKLQCPLEGSVTMVVLYVTVSIICNTCSSMEKEKDLQILTQFLTF